MRIKIRQTQDDYVDDVSLVEELIHTATECLKALALDSYGRSVYYVRVSGIRDWVRQHNVFTMKQYWAVERAADYIENRDNPPRANFEVGQQDIACLSILSDLGQTRICEVEARNERNAMNDYL